MRRIKELTEKDEIAILLRPIVERIRCEENAINAGYDVGNAVSMMCRYMESIYGREEAELFKDGLRRALVGEL